MSYQVPNQCVPRWRLDLRGLCSKASSYVLSPEEKVDLSRVRFITPGGLVGLACLLESWIEEHGELSLVVPDNLDVLGYMHRMDFFELFRDNISLNKSLSYLNTRSRHPAGLSELRRVRSKEAASEVSKQFYDILASKGGLQKTELDYCCEVLTESLNNVLEHADSPCGAYTAIQKWSVLDKVAVAVADAGVGIPHTICNHPKAQQGALSDSALIELAAEDQVSRYVPNEQQEERRGGGLTAALRSVGRGRGGLIIWSKQGWIQFSGVGRTESTELVHTFEGTCVEAEFPLNSA